MSCLCALRVLVEFNFLSDHERRLKEKVRAGEVVMTGEELRMRNQGLRWIPLREGWKKKKRKYGGMKYDRGEGG